MDSNLRLRIASELVKMAKEVVGREFTEQEWKSYKKKHPGANKSDHTITKSKGKDEKTFDFTNKDDIKDVAKAQRGEAKKAPAKKAPTQEGGPKHKKTTPKFKSMKSVKSIMSQHGLDEESDEVAEMMGFKKAFKREQLSQKDVEEGAKARNVAQLKADFIRKMNPANYDSPEAFKKAQERMKKMPATDFGKILAQLTEEED